MNGGFAGGLAQGLRNGMAMYELYQEGQERKRKRKVDEELAAAMRGQQSTAEGVGQPQIGLKDTLVSDQAMRDLQQQPMMAGTASESTPVQAYPVEQVGLQQTLMTTNPAPGQPQAASAEGAGLRAAGDIVSPGLAFDIQRRQAMAGGNTAKKGSPAAARMAGGDDFGALADSLTRGYRKALELGEPGRAMELLVQREKTVGQFRDQAFGEAMTRYEATGDPNAFVSYVNRFAPTSMEITGITRRQETAGGQPMFVATGIDHETGQPFQRPFSQQSLQNMLRAIGDPSVYKTMFAEQAKHHYELELERQKQMARADANVSQAERIAPIEHRYRMAEIGAQGAESRRTAAARGSIDNKVAAPAEVRTAQWLIDNGVAKDASGAWDMVRGARTKPREQYILETSRMLLSNQDPMAFGDTRLTPQQAVRQAEQLYDSLQGGQDQQAASAEVPAVGYEEDGYRFKGGNPADPSNWEKL